MGFSLGTTGRHGKRPILGRRFIPAALFAVIMAVTASPAWPGGSGAPGLVIVVMGDSLSAGYNLPPDAGFVPRLEAHLARNGIAARVVDASVSGDTSSSGQARIDWAITGTPDLVILELGANDALRGIDPGLTRANLDNTITALRARGLNVLLAGMLAPPNMGQEYTGAFNAIYPDLAAAHGIPLYPFFLDGVAARPEFLQADLMHPTAAGIDVIVRGIAPMIIEALGAAGN